MTVRNFNNTSLPQALTSGIGNVPSVDTAIPVPSTAGYPDPPFILGIERGTTNQEVCLCTDIPNSTTFNVIRGYLGPGVEDGGPCVTHPAGAIVEHTSAAIDFAEANTYVNILQALGDLLVYGDSGPTNLGVGSNGQVLTADDTQPDGLAWEALPAAPVFPAGVVAYTAASSPPSGWLLCNGDSVLRSGEDGYPALFSAIGTTYGSVDGTHFTLPDLRNRFAMGAGGSYSRGNTGGSSTHTLSVAEIPSHTHTFLMDSEPAAWWVAINYPTSTINFQMVESSSDTAPITYTPPSNSSVGGGAAHSILNPYLALNAIIKT